jgi:multiple sugar transport system substrate-binding protein
MTKGDEHGDPVQKEGRISRREFVIRALGAGIAVSPVGAILTACGGGSTTVQQGNEQSIAMGSSSQPLSKKYSGQTIAVALAITAMDKKLLDKFTSQTGVKVKWTVYGWDALQDKITAAASANTFFADVTDVDWSRVGLYAHTKWFATLKFSDLNSLKEDVPQLDVFTVNGQLIGMPNDASIMVTTVNTKNFEQAGITKMPATFDEYEKGLKQIQKAGVNAQPLGIPFAAAEGLSTYWYQLTGGAFGGRILSDKFEPLFTDKSSPGYKAMEWMVEQYKSGMVPKENINITDTSQQQSQMALDKISSIFSDYSGNVSIIYNVPSQSKVVDQVKYIPTPGINGTGANLGNPDGVGIPVSARHKGAAAEFKGWYRLPHEVE